MKQSNRIAAFATLISMLSAAVVHGADPITTRSLLSEMTDLSRLATLPSPAYTCAQSSSQDPQSISPADPKTWFANEDWDHWHGIERRGDRTEYVLMHADGPGAVVRIWSANPAGTLRIYIDGDSKHTLEAPMEEILGGRLKGVPEPIAGVQGKGFNFYLPIPYSKSCTVTTDQKGFYYSVDYRTYAEGTAVTSFTPNDLVTNADEIARQAKSLATPRSARIASEQRDAVSVSIAPGATAVLGRLDGARAISALHLQMPADLSEAALRGAVLKITFDGEQTVETPLGDFFGSAPGINPFETLPLGMTRAGALYAHWLMPFRESAVVEVENLSKTPIAFTGEIGSVAREWNDRSLHFHAGYRAEFNRDSKPLFDWNYLTANGRGRFVGVSFAIDNPVEAWWGEGDEKFYVDGETQPSWFGTGTEDYYGYAWGSSDLFQHAYHSQSRCDGPANYGRTSVNRFHIMDDVPFTKSFKFDMEIWHWDQCKLNFAATTYWYSMPGGSGQFAALTPADVVVSPMPPYMPTRIAGAIEGESMRVLQHTGDVGPQAWSGTSGDQQLLWKCAKPGDALALEFDAPTAGRFRIIGRFLKADDYGIVELAVNGRKLGGPLDLYHDGVQPADEIDLGVADVVAGLNKLEVTSVGTNDKGKRLYLFGLDYLLLKPAVGTEP